MAPAPPTALELERRRASDAAARRAAARHAPKPPMRKNRSYARRIREAGPKVKDHNDNYAPAVGNFDGVLNMHEGYSLKSSPRSANGSPRLTHQGSRAQLGWARWQRLQAWLGLKSSERRRVWYAVVEAALTAQLANVEPGGRRRRCGIDDGFGLRPPQSRDMRAYAHDSPRHTEWLRLTRPSAAELGPTTPFRQSSISKFLQDVALEQPQEGSGRLPTPLRMTAAGHTAFALPAARPHHPLLSRSLPPLTVEQLARRNAPQELRCGGTLVHDGVLFSRSA